MLTNAVVGDQYMDKDEFENELKQVLGDTRAAFDISERDTLIFGAHGILVAGRELTWKQITLCSWRTHAC